MEDHLKNDRAFRKAKENVEKWGQQPPGDLSAALAEELGELLDEVLTEDCPELDGPEYDPTGALWVSMSNTRRSGLAVQRVLDEHYGPDDSPNLPVRDDMDVEAVREELYDIMALCYQLDWALYQGVEADD